MKKYILILVGLTTFSCSDFLDEEVFTQYEPTAFLDIKNKKMIHELLVDLSQNHNKTILVSTHDITFCQLHSDKVWLVKDGELNEKLANEIKESDFD